MCNLDFTQKKIVIKIYLPGNGAHAVTILVCIIGCNVWINEWLSKDYYILLKLRLGYLIIIAIFMAPKTSCK